MLFGNKGATTGGWVGGPDPPKYLDGPPNFLDVQCDYRYVTDCSVRT